ASGRHAGHRESAAAPRQQLGACRRDVVDRRPAARPAGGGPGRSDHRAGRPRHPRAPLQRDRRSDRRQGRGEEPPPPRSEPPGARLRVGLTGLTIAEYFRDDERKVVLLFIDNIFRFTQAGSEVSALLGRMPSAVGYQPTLATEMGELQERITSTKKGSITS